MGLENHFLVFLREWPFYTGFTVFLLNVRVQFITHVLSWVMGATAIPHIARHDDT